jgi:hypothetical protein
MLVQLNLRESANSADKDFDFLCVLRVSVVKYSSSM